MKSLSLMCTLMMPVLSAAVVRAEDRSPNVIVFYTDDHGHADLSCQGVLDDIRTPNVDALAKSGVLARHGYSTAPQCVPSRAGLMVGKFQSRFGVEANGKPLNGFDRELTIAERLQEIGYVTAQFGKWHLGPGPQITQHGFKHVFNQNAQRPFAANITLDGQDREMANLSPEMYHVDGCSRAAASLIERYKDSPFFLYVAYRAPHVPLDAPKKYLDRFPGKMPQRRRQALAMLSAVDDGVGLITNTLAEHGLREKTLIFYIGDNGAPLKIYREDAPGGGPGWDGSLNDPLNGEKGMLSEGGMHVPFVISWPGTIPPGQVYDHPISALDVAATTAAIAELEIESDDLDGVNLLPHLTGKVESPPHDALMWRWVAQSAIRAGKWKLLRGGEREYLYDLDADLEEKHNLATRYPEVATRLREQLTEWAATLDPPGLAAGGMSPAATSYFDFYLDGKPAPPQHKKVVPKTAATRSFRGWIARNGELSIQDKALRLVGDDKGSKTPFLAYSRLSVPGPVTATLQWKTNTSGKAFIAWRTSTQKDFQPECQKSFDVTVSGEWQTYRIDLPVQGKLIHLRVKTPAGTTLIREFKIESASSQPIQLW
jgi:arylsulfatase A-like enzyme